VAVCPHYCTDPDVTWEYGRGCPLVVHCWADLQLVHELHCYGNIARMQNVSEWLYSLYAWLYVLYVWCILKPWSMHTHTTVLRPFFWDNPGEPVPEKFWTLRCKGRLTEADTLTIRPGATPSGPTSAHLHHSPIFFMGQMPFLLPNQQCQSTEGQGRRH